MSALSGLEDTCPKCERLFGDHTMREFAACLGTTMLDVPFERVAPEAVPAASEALRRQFQLDDDLIVADTVVIRSALLSGHAGQVGVKIPALIHEFSLGSPAAPPTIVAKVVFIGSEDSVTRYGKLVRDSANGAVNASRRS